MANATLDRLIVQLNTSPTAKSDTALWQVIIQLIKRLKELENEVSNSSGGGGSSVTNYITNLTQYLDIAGDFDGAQEPVIVLPSSGSSTPSISEDYVVCSDGVVVTPTPIDDGAGNFIYVAYTP